MREAAMSWAGETVTGFGGRSWEELYDRVVLPVGHL
jgi:hypothetical protein